MQGENCITSDVCNQEYASYVEQKLYNWSIEHFCYSRWCKYYNSLFILKKESITVVMVPVLFILMLYNHK